MSRTPPTSLLRALRKLRDDRATLRFEAYVVRENGVEVDSPREGPNFFSDDPVVNRTVIPIATLTKALRDGYLEMLPRQIADRWPDGRPIYEGMRAAVPTEKGLDLLNEFERLLTQNKTRNFVILKPRSSNSDDIPGPLLLVMDVKEKRVHVDFEWRLEDEKDTIYHSSVTGSRRTAWIRRDEVFGFVSDPRDYVGYRDTLKNRDSELLRAFMQEHEEIEARCQDIRSKWESERGRISSEFARRLAASSGPIRSRPFEDDELDPEDDGPSDGGMRP